jgi:hypothetical protein
LSFLSFKKYRHLAPAFLLSLGTLILIFNYSACSVDTQFIDMKSAANDSDLGLSMSTLPNLDEGTSGNITVSLNKPNTHNDLKFNVFAREVSINDVRGFGFDLDDPSKTVFQESTSATTTKDKDLLKLSAQTLAKKTISTELSIEALDDGVYTGTRYWLISVEVVKFGNDNTVGATKVRSLRTVVRIKDATPIPQLSVDDGIPAEGSLEGEDIKFIVRLQWGGWVSGDSRLYSYRRDSDCWRRL